MRVNILAWSNQFAHSLYLQSQTETAASEFEQVSQPEPPICTVPF